MNLIRRHIEYLLTAHDCVIVPDLGAFIATSCKAEYNPDEGSWKAPRRMFTFNEELKVSDGIFTSSVARALSIEYEAASKLVRQNVAELKKDLFREGEFDLGLAGRFETSLLGEIRYIAPLADRLTPLCGWAGYVYAELESNGRRHTSKRVRSHRRDEKKELPRVTRFIRTAAGAAAAILIAIVASTPITWKDAYKASTVPQFSAATTIEFSQNEKPDMAVTTDNRVAEREALEPSDNADIIEKATTKEIESTMPSWTEYNEASVENSVRLSSDDKYIVVVGSARTRSEAEKFVAQKYAKYGVELEIVDCGDKFRVYAATGSTIKEAKAQSENPLISENFENAWITRR